MRGKNYKVFVDAKILGRDNLLSSKKTFIAYVVKDKNLKGVKKVVAEQTNIAECKAILFAIGRLKTKLNRFTVYCDHDSVVSEARKSLEDKPSNDRLINRIRQELTNSNGRIKLESFEKNPAHALLNDYKNRKQAKGSL